MVTGIGDLISSTDIVKLKHRSRGSRLLYKLIESWTQIQIIQSRKLVFSGDYWDLSDVDNGGECTYVNSKAQVRW